MCDQITAPLGWCQRHGVITLLGFRVVLNPTERSGVLVNRVVNRLTRCWGPVPEVQPLPLTVTSGLACFKAFFRDVRSVNFIGHLHAFLAEDGGPEAHDVGGDGGLGESWVTDP